MKSRPSVAQIRLMRFVQLLHDEYHGSPTEFSEKTGYSTPNFVSRLKSGRKKISDGMARNIERHARKEPNYLDSLDGEPPTTLWIGGKEVTLEPLESQLAQFFRGLSEGARESLLGRAQTLYSAEHPETTSSAHPYAEVVELASAIRTAVRKIPKQAAKRAKVRAR